MRKKPTEEQARQIAQILSGITLDIRAQSFTWGTVENKRQALALCHALSGYKPKTHCFSCYLRTANILAEAIGLPPYDHGTSQERREARLAICATCPAFHPSTRSCGRFILDAINPQPVTIDGKAVNPCGCQLDLKASMKYATCPAGKW